MTGPYIILVEFTLHTSGAMPAFRALIDENARQSCRLEPGCQRFDVLLPKGRDDRVLLYEIYDTRAAFDVHLSSAHFHQFDMASAAMVRAKVVSEFSLACEGSRAQTT